MGYILPEIYHQVCKEENIETPKIFIETGTFKGGVPHRIMETYRKLDKYFDTYYTIEIDPKICRIASHRFKVFEKTLPNYKKEEIHSDVEDLEFSEDRFGSYFENRLRLYCGDSSKKLVDVLDSASQHGYDKFCFWLDAHSGAAKYGRGDDDVPLFNELEVLKRFGIGKGSVIAIDDAHLFGEVQKNNNGEIVCDYTDITFEKVKEKILEMDPNFDVFICEPYNMKMLIAV